MQGRLFSAVYLLSAAFLVFVAGAVVTLAEVYPSTYIRDAYRGGLALHSQMTAYTDPLATDLWAQARTPEQGVTVHDPDRAANGLTLYTSAHANKAFLIAMDGRVAHEWHRPFSTVWDSDAAVPRPVPDDQIYFRKAQVFPNGDLLAIYIGVGDSPWGYGMVRLDKDSNVLWKNLERFHHDFAVAGDGRIFGLTHAFRSEPMEGVDHLPKPVLDDYLVILSPEGRTLKRISLLDAINRSIYRQLLWRVPYYSLEDPLHTNTVNVLDRESAAALANRLPMARHGQVLLSFRELAGGSIALLDVEDEEIVWATHGPWLSQHDPDVLPNGNILVFDNRGHYGKGNGGGSRLVPEGRSRVIEVDPATGGVVWSFAGDEKRPFESLIRSAQERLPNGNTLITESDGGRLLEVTPDGEIVWEFINPVRAGESGRRIPIVSWGQRIDPGSLQAGFRSGIDNRLLAREAYTR